MNGDDTFPWAKKPAVPDNRKRAVSKKTVERVSASRFCQKCALQGIVSPIHLFQINDEEALLMCKNADCTFMQSSNWESLVVKRNISRLSVASNRKSSSSASSQLSSKSDRNNRGSLERTTKSVSRSRYSTLPLASPLQTLPQQSSSDVVSEDSSPIQRFIFSPASLQDSSLEGKERKTLVPIAPFLSGHAHSFSSFETNKLEHKFQQREAFVQQRIVPPSVTQSTSKHCKVTLIPNNSNLGINVGSKRRACSLDSDSLSSGSSSLDSRPTTPVSETLNGKKVRRIVVAPETLSKLLDGSMQLEIRKSHTTGADVVFRSMKKTPITSSCSTKSQGTYSEPGQVEIKGRSSDILVKSERAGGNTSSVKDSGSTSGSLETAAVGSLHDIVRSNDSTSSLPALSTISDLTTSRIESINFQVQADSIKSHIEAINLHIQAINSAIGRSDICAPVHFSNLCQKFSPEVRNEPITDVVCDESQQITSEADSSSRNSFTSFDHLETQIAVSAELPLDSDTSLPSHLGFEGLGLLDNHSHTSHLDSDTDFRSSVNGILEGRI